MSCRKKIDSKLWLNYAQTMETEVRTLKQELASTQEALKAATKRCRDLVRELDNRTVGHESERALRDQQLSRILRALLVLEARLKQEQKSIRQQLCEKDNVIRNQQLEIAKLRRYTKNYIKCKREQNLGKQTMGVDIIEAAANIEKASFETSAALKTEPLDPHRDSSLSKDIQNLKCEIITKLNHSDSSSVVLDDLDRGIRKTHSFAGSDISKTSLTSSENTDASIITTTTEGGSPSLLSTEGFCEGESTDVSPGSTLNKSSRCTPTMVTDSENETTMIFDDDDDEEVNMMDVGAMRSSKRKGKSKNAMKDVPNLIETTTMKRTESKDDGMDCNFVSEDEEREQEPIYVNSCNETNARNVLTTMITTTVTTTTVTSTTTTTTINALNVQGINDDQRNNNDEMSTKIDMNDQSVEETSGNWYSDPDEDRISDDVFRHSSYRPNSNHNSVLECVNQILLRDMEEEENILSVPRRFKHRGRIVRFQPARLSDIESVGSEMERKNSEECAMDREAASGEFNNVEEPAGGSFEPTASEDEFGMKIDRAAVTNFHPNDDAEAAMSLNEPEQKAVPILIIEPNVDVEVDVSRSAPAFATNSASGRSKSSMQPISPPLKLERMEEKTCLQMSSKGLTLAKNLDYEDIESLPEVSTPPPKTPPALPPKPQFRNNTLILKKIPSPSFLIDETRKKLQLLDNGPADHGKRIFGLLSSPAKSSASARSLNFDEPPKSSAPAGEEAGFWKNRFNNVRSSFQVRQAGDASVEQPKRVTPRVTNIVRQFEEFKIGGDCDERGCETKERGRSRHVQHPEFEQEFDIRHNFEEFNLDECDLSDDPDRPEGDGSERLGGALGNAVGQNENAANDNNNVAPPTANNPNSGYDHFLEATGLSNKSILTPSRLLSNHKSMLKPKDVKYKNKIKATAIMEKHGASTTTTTTTHVRHWTGPFV